MKIPLNPKKIETIKIEKTEFLKKNFNRAETEIQKEILIYLFILRTKRRIPKMGTKNGYR